MKLGVLTVLFGGKAKETCAYLSGLGVETVEIGCGGFRARLTANPKSCLPTRESIRSL